MFKQIISMLGVAPKPETPPYSGFYVQNRTSSDITASIVKNNGNAPSITVEYSADGDTWYTMGTTSTSAITATVPANGRTYFRASANYWGNRQGTHHDGYYHTFTCSGNYNACGNIMSMLYGSSFTGEETEFPGNYEQQFYSFFRNSSTLISAEDLVLPAMHLTYSCYYFFFETCTNLVCVPELPATHMAGYCYGAFFENCYSLTTSPALNSENLATGCYSGMFDSCRSLVTPPDLLCQTGVASCYEWMFNGCSSLQYIKCTLPDNASGTFTPHWTSNVSGTGTFVKAAGASWPSGMNGIPSGWTVQEV